MYPIRRLTSAELSSRRRLLIVTCRAVALYCFAAWVYVALVALFQPQTLPWQLTHLTKWPRTDTFGEISFVLSFIAYWCYRLLLPANRTTPATNDDRTRRSR